MHIHRSTRQMSALLARVSPTQAVVKCFSVVLVRLTTCKRLTNSLPKLSVITRWHIFVSIDSVEKLVHQPQSGTGIYLNIFSTTAGLSSSS